MTKFFEHRKRKRVPVKSVVVFYHADCTDGFTAAWAAWKKFGNKAEYVPHFHEDEPLKISGREIFTLDMTFPEAVTKRLMLDNRCVTAIDHHISTKAVTLMTRNYSYALNHSGSTLTWKYFFPQKPIPKFLLVVEDVDLWSHKIEGGLALYAYLDLFDFNFRVWSQLIRDFEIPSRKKKMLETGRILLKYGDKKIERNINKNAGLVMFEGHRVYAMNETEFIDISGAKLARLLPPFAIIWREKKDSQISVSLRGTGQIDLSPIAKKYGGGGHRNSAAFRLPSIKDIPWKPVKHGKDKQKT